ncbi:MAG: hypothetical protein JO272_01175 [Pseudonocardiales bacterium]|nr:hypothetical protein [Pseudonocardiales bacterium]
MLDSGSVYKRVGGDMSEGGVTRYESRRWLVQEPPVGVNWDSNSDLAGIVAAAVRSGADLTIEQHTVTVRTYLTVAPTPKPTPEPLPAYSAVPVRNLQWTADNISAVAVLVGASGLLAALFCSNALLRGLVAVLTHGVTALSVALTVAAGLAVLGLARPEGRNRKPW